MSDALQARRESILAGASADHRRAGAAPGGELGDVRVPSRLEFALPIRTSASAPRPAARYF